MLLGLVPPAYALDCQKATSPMDKAICANPQAAAADQALNAAYSALAARSTANEKKQLLDSQRAWLKLRAGTCTDDKNNPLPKCLIERTQRRAAFLQGKPESGPGTGHDLTPIIIAQTGSKKLYELAISVSKFPAPELPGEKLFNSEIAKLLKDAPSTRDSSDQPDMTYTYDLDLRVTYASPKLLSVSMETYMFEGGAHGNSGTNTLNIDVAKGKMIGFEDAFETAAHQKLEDLCLKQIEVQKKEKDETLDPDPKEMKKTRDTIAETLGKLDNWSFSATQGDVSFDPYVIGSYAEGAYSCTFNIDVLRPLYKPGSILP